ncbi:hypothetical protein N431DRAFT_496593 [Stipitochalara longipes BDJ]|nr:hypothetical protein N431DRAFT_496593 [Stipitochalara longipes BDJ]
MLIFQSFPSAYPRRSYRLQHLLEKLPRLALYNSKHFTTTLNPIPKFVPNRLKNLLSDLPKLTVLESELCLDKFTLFPNLPTELRTKMWNYACHHPRILLLTDNWHARANNRESIDNHNKAPTVLHTCSEARGEGLKYYTACTKQIYINFAVDHFRRQAYQIQDAIPLDKLQLEVSDLAKIQIIDLPHKQCQWRVLSELSLFLLLNYLREVNMLVDFNITRLLQTIRKEPLMQDLHARHVGKECISQIWSKSPGKSSKSGSSNISQNFSICYKFFSRDHEELDPIPTHADFTS